MSCFSVLRNLVGIPRDAEEKACFSKEASLPKSSQDTLVTHDSSLSTLKEEKEKQGHASDTTDRLEVLRSLMKEEGLDAYLVPSQDAHDLEYAAHEFHRLAFISGFTGDSGTAIITKSKAYLFTDSRYHIQASEQLDGNWTLHKVPSDTDWDQTLVDLSDKRQMAIGIDPKLITYSTAKPILARLTSSGSTFNFPTRNLVDIVWGTGRPTPSTDPIVIHPLKYAGEAAEKKLERVASWLSDGASGSTSPFKKGSPYFISQLDMIAWLLNLRGGSVPNNPIFYAYLIVAPSSLSRSKSNYSATLFVEQSLLSPEAYRYLVEQLDVDVRGYDSVWDFLISGEWELLAQGEVMRGEKPELVCDEQVSWATVNAVGEENIHLQGVSPIATWKAQKNDTELQGMRNAYLRDGVAWAKWAAWLEEAVQVKGLDIDEKQAADALVEARSQSEMYAGMEAYEPISATGKNAALPHYETPELDSSIIDRQTPYLMDSGGQYLDGTIDTTRTVHFGKPTPKQKQAFTRVLQGHIAIDTAIFPKGTTGGQLDSLARHPLWKDGLDYGHGTGHGIGAYLQVHEGPQRIAARSNVPLLPRMCMSNEPGYYEEGNFGIRIESIVAVKEVKVKNADQTWLGFERLTRVPIDRRLVNFSLLTKEESAWLREHNHKVKTDLLSFVQHDARAVKWLKRQ